MTPTQSAILACLSDGREATLGGLAEGAGLTGPMRFERTLRAAENLAAEGLVERVFPGAYRLPRGGPET